MFAVHRGRGYTLRSSVSETIWELALGKPTPWWDQRRGYRHATRSTTTASTSRQAPMRAPATQHCHQGLDSAQSRRFTSAVAKLCALDAQLRAGADGPLELHRWRVRENADKAHVLQSRAENVGRQLPLSQ